MSAFTRVSEQARSIRTSKRYILRVGPPFSFVLLHRAPGVAGHVRFPQTPGAAVRSRAAGAIIGHWRPSISQERGCGGQDTVNNRQGRPRQDLVCTGFKVQTPRPPSSMPWLLSWPTRGKASCASVRGQYCQGVLFPAEVACLQARMRTSPFCPSAGWAW